MLPDIHIPRRFRPYAHQCSRRNSRYTVRLHAYSSVFLFGCLVVLMGACTSGTTPPSPHNSASNQPTSPPKTSVAPGTVLYQANWSQGLDGWKVGNGWSVIQGVLQGNCGDSGVSLTAPYMPAVTNYAVEARIQVVRLLHKNGGFYSIFANQVAGKDGYQGGVSDLKGPGPRPNGSNAQLQIYIEPASHMAPGSFQPSDNDPGTQWHTYRVDVQGSTATLEVNGQPVHSATSIQTDSLSNGPLGVSCGSAVLRISSFRILAL